MPALDMGKFRYLTAVGKHPAGTFQQPDNIGKNEAYKPTVFKNTKMRDQMTRAFIARKVHLKESDFNLS